MIADGTHRPADVIKQRRRGLGTPGAVEEAQPTFRDISGPDQDRITPSIRVRWHVPEQHG
jgi:hypothetical protein